MSAFMAILRPTIQIYINNKVKREKSKSVSQKQRATISFLKTRSPFANTATDVVIYQTVNSVQRALILLSN